jgi:hypothetical protein
MTKTHCRKHTHISKVYCMHIRIYTYIYIYIHLLPCTHTTFLRLHVLLAGSTCACATYGGIISRSAFSSGIGVLSDGTDFTIRIGKSIFDMDVNVEIGYVHEFLCTSYVYCTWGTETTC